MPLTPNHGTLVEELDRATSALSRANVAAVDPYRNLVGALLDAVVAVQELIEDQSERIDGSPDA